MEDCWLKFGKHVKEQLDLFDFKHIYKNIYEKGEFEVSVLTRLVLLTLYNQEIHGKNEGIVPLSTYLAVLKGENPEEELSYDSLLFIVAYCHKLYLASCQNSLDQLVMYC